MTARGAIVLRVTILLRLSLCFARLYRPCSFFASSRHRRTVSLGQIVNFKRHFMQPSDSTLQNALPFPGRALTVTVNPGNTSQHVVMMKVQNGAVAACRSLSQLRSFVFTIRTCCALCVRSSCRTQLGLTGEWGGCTSQIIVLFVAPPIVLHCARHPSNPLLSLTPGLTGQPARLSSVDHGTLSSPPCAGRP